MKAKDKLIERVSKDFQRYKGKASVYCFSKDVIPVIIRNIISRFVFKHPSGKVFIVVDCYNTRQSIMKYIKENSITVQLENNVKALSADFIKEQYTYNYSLTIIVGINDNFNLINKLHTESKFTLAILTKNIMNNKFITSVRNILPCIETADLDISIAKDNVYSPVEERRYGVSLSDKDKTAYEEYTKYITECVIIFGSIDTIEKCRIGDTKLGLSSTEILNTIAKENGWREDLDTTIPFIKQIDDTYNPNILSDRASNFYNISKLRRDLVTDNKAKLNTILDICRNNSDKQILIISKRGEFAAKITKYLLENNIKCGDYHDCIEDAIYTDDYGNPILVKSGVKKGKPRIAGHQLQSTQNETRFNNKSINVLSIKSSSNTKLKIACDIVIFTSPLCDNIVDTKTRFTNIVFNNIPTKSYMIYCNSTIEQAKLAKTMPNNIITVIDETDNFIGYDENSGDIIL